MTITTLKGKAMKIGAEEFVEGFIVYDGAKAYCVPETATLTLVNGVLTTSAVTEEVDPATVEFVDLSEVLTEKTVKSTALQRTIHPDEGKVGFSKIIVKKIDGGETEAGFEIGDKVYFELPFKYKNLVCKNPEYTITLDGSDKKHYCYKGTAVDAGEYMGIEIEYLNGTKGIIVLLNDIVNKFFIQKIVE